jgi:hypothetical protein
MADRSFWLASTVSQGATFITHCFSCTFYNFTWTLEGFHCVFRLFNKILFSTISEVDFSLIMA